MKNKKEIIFNIHVGGDKQPAATLNKRVIYRCKFTSAINLPYPANELNWAKIAEYRVLS